MKKNQTQLLSARILNVSEMKGIAGAITDGTLPFYCSINNSCIEYYTKAQCFALSGCALSQCTRRMCFA